VACRTGGAECERPLSVSLWRSSSGISEFRLPSIGPRGTSDCDTEMANAVQQLSATGNGEVNAR
jgi:hypothetical protein